MTFDEIIDKVYELWGDQVEKATMAEKLLSECESIEKQMLKLLDIASDMYPQGYQEFLDSFKGMETRLERERKKENES